MQPSIYEWLTLISLSRFVGITFSLFFLHIVKKNPRSLANGGKENNKQKIKSYFNFDQGGARGKHFVVRCDINLDKVQAGLLPVPGWVFV
jgi:hypothetical protein